MKRGEAFDKLEVGQKLKGNISGIVKFGIFVTFGGLEGLVHISTAPGESVAKMWSGILEEHGIRSLLKGGGLQASMYASPLAVKWEIHVLESQVEKALEILAPFLEDQHLAEP